MITNWRLKPLLGREFVNNLFFFFKPLTRQHCSASMLTNRTVYVKNVLLTRVEIIHTLTFNEALPQCRSLCGTHRDLTQNIWSHSNAMTGCHAAEWLCHSSGMLTIAAVFSSRFSQAQPSQLAQASSHFCVQLHKHMSNENRNKMQGALRSRKGHS